MPSYSKQFLSGSTNGRGVKVAATATPGTLIHTADATAKDELWLFVYNSDTQDRKITFEVGGTTAPDDNEGFNVPAGESIAVLQGQILSGGLLLRAFGAAANVLVVFGFVNRISG